MAIMVTSLLQYLAYFLRAGFKEEKKRKKEMFARGTLKILLCLEQHVHNYGTNVQLFLILGVFTIFP